MSNVKKKTKKEKKHISKIRARLFISIVALLGVTFAVILVAADPVLTLVLTRRTASSLINVADSIENTVPDSSTYYLKLYNISVSSGCDFEILSDDGMILYRSDDHSSAESSSHFSSALSDDSLFFTTARVQIYDYGSEKGIYEKRRSRASSAEYLCYSRELSADRILHIYSPVSAIDANVEIAVQVFTIVCIFICSLMLVFVYLYASRFTKPLREMNDVTKDMASLSFGRRCKHYGNDEIGELGSSINTLSSKLDRTLKDLRKKNRQLEADIEHRQVLDNARKDLINNVSHELKTPIAIISGYAEGLSSGMCDDKETANEYSHIILDESKKMNLLVTELLELSRLESDIVPLNAAKYSLSEQLDYLLSHFSILFSKNGITVEKDYPDGLMCVAQQDKIETVLKNYISNAVSHCSGSKIIKIRTEQSAKNIRVYVFNTGEHISDNDINDIWQSFYRADKARSRSENRFGLGLSIVKAIMMNHSKECGVNNTENGVEFWFEVQKA